MSAPDHERADSSAGRGNESVPRTLRRRIGRAIFFLALGTVLYLALMPSDGHARFRIVSLPVFRWIAAHDDFDNIAAFAALALAAFLVGRDPSERENAGVCAAVARRFASRLARLAGLLTMVCIFEVLQKWIPGRVSSLEDVCTGWSGIFAAWLVSELLDARVKSPAHAASVMH